jgi:hypothetical protein
MYGKWPILGLKVLFLGAIRNKKEIALTVRAIVEISGKLITTVFNMISLLKLSDEIQAAIRAYYGTFLNNYHPIYPLS